MNVTVAKTAGFCFGVKRAVEKVYEQIQKTDKPIYTYGPIIHNEEVVKDLKKKETKNDKLKSKGEKVYEEKSFSRISSRNDGIGKRHKRICR